jgi:hypothetical protein
MARNGKLPKIHNYSQFTVCLKVSKNLDRSSDYEIYINMVKMEVTYSSPSLQN